MVANFKAAVMSSIFLTLITITVQMKIETSQWKKIPPNLTAEIPRLFKEFEQKDSQMKTLADHSHVKKPSGIFFAEVEAYPRGPLYTFVTVEFDTSKKVSATGSNEKDIKFVVALVLGRIDNKKLNLDIYYLITAGQIIEYDELGYTKGLELPDESAIAALKQLGFGPGTVVWHDGVWSDMKLEMTGNSKDNLKKEMRNRLRLESISFPVDKIDLKNKAYGSIQFEGDKLSTLRVAVYQLTQNSGSLTTVFKNKAKNGLFSDPKPKPTSGRNLEQRPKTNEQLFFCVVLDKRSSGTKVLYTSKPTSSKSEAFANAEIFATKYLIWDNDTKGMDDFEILKVNNDNLRLLVAKALVRKKILQTQLADYMTNENASFPETLNSYVNLILTLDKDIIENTVKPNEIPHELSLSILDQVFSQTDKLSESLKLQYRKVNNLVTTTTIIQTLYWFETQHGDKILQCVVRVATNPKKMNEIDLEITDIFEDEEHFSVQTRQDMLANETFTTNQIPLYWHSEDVKVIRPVDNSKNAVDLFKTYGLKVFLPQIQAAMKMARVKGEMPENLYDFSNVKFASRLHPNHKQGEAVQSGIYFTAKFSNDPICYIFCMIRVNRGGVEFILPEGSTMYDTEKAVIDAMETMLIAAES